MTKFCARVLMNFFGAILLFTIWTYGSETKEAPITKITSEAILENIYKFLIIKEIALFQQSCRLFKTMKTIGIFGPNELGIIKLCGGGTEVKEFRWELLQYVSNVGFHTVLYDMESIIFNSKKDHYLIQNPDNTMVSWFDNENNYDDLLNKIPNQTDITLKYNFVPQEYNDLPPYIQKQLENFKVILTNSYEEHVALLVDGNLISWKNDDGQKINIIPEEMKCRLQNNIKMIYTSFFGGFAALLNNRSLAIWNLDPLDVHIYPEKIKMIAFNHQKAISALLESGDVIYMEKNELPTTILKNQNVKSIVATKRAFAYLTVDGHVFTKGEDKWGRVIPSTIYSDLQDVKILISSDKAFAALRNDGIVLSWGKCSFSEARRSYIHISTHEAIRNVKMIFSARDAFAALKNDNSVYLWGRPESGGALPPNDPPLVNVKTIFSSFQTFVALLYDNKVRSWGAKIDDNIMKILNKRGVSKIFPENYGFRFVCLDGSEIEWEFEV